MSGLPGPGDDLGAQAAAVVRERTDLVPRIGVVLGSGLGPALGESLQETASFRFEELHGFPPSAVPGHAGRLVLGTLAVSRAGSSLARTSIHIVLNTDCLNGTYIVGSVDSSSASCSTLPTTPTIS